MRLAIHPRMPPMMSHRIKFILSLLLCAMCFFSFLTPSPNCVSALCNTSDVKAPQPDFFSHTAGANVVPYDGNRGDPLISRELFFCVLHFERKHSFVPCSSTSNAILYEHIRGMI
jgi:hypothetical protein